MLCRGFKTNFKRLRIEKTLYCDLSFLRGKKGIAVHIHTNSQQKKVKKVCSRKLRNNSSGIAVNP